MHSVALGMDEALIQDLRKVDEAVWEEIDRGLFMRLRLVYATKGGSVVKNEE